MDAGIRQVDFGYFRNCCSPLYSPQSLKSTDNGAKTLYLFLTEISETQCGL